ncbi:30S ribosomal protein S14 [Paenibacillus sp. YPG26]|uniref:30S ribosomal protein S14 n=1 Tax=Paenibacillus sp. YPG26 TaxID=2878915 RepID=UPI002041C32E|nr:30S ribosomal protein S14 [Paenibacillus sp. YPG26]USB32189.1 30S ribosomal protein S14 [Paenibacillus sp. YPG26]
MAIKSKVAKEKQRREMVAKYAERRRELKKNGEYALLHKLPRNASPVRLRNRCEVTGRPRGYLSRYHVSRIVFRELAHHGQIPGVRKASW